MRRKTLRELREDTLVFRFSCSTERTDLHEVARAAAQCTAIAAAEAMALPWDVEGLEGYRDLRVDVPLSRGGRFVRALLAAGAETSMFGSIDWLPKESQKGVTDEAKDLLASYGLLSQLSEL